MFPSMQYCPETVLVQSALFLAEKLSNLEEKKAEVVAPAVNVVTGSIVEVSKGLSIHGEEDPHLLPIEKRALHCKLHFWLYKTWCQCYDHGDLDGGDDLDGFPPLPRFGTRMFVSVVENMEWGHLLIECLLHSPLNTLSQKLEDIISAVSDHPDPKDIALFTLLFDNMLDLESCGINPEHLSSSEILIIALSSLNEHICEKNTQVLLLKRMIEFVFQCCFGAKLPPERTGLGLSSKGNSSQLHRLNESNSMEPAQRPLDVLSSIPTIEKLTLKELQKLQDSLENSFSSVRQNGPSKAFPCKSHNDDGHDSYPKVEVSKVLYCLEVLMKLYTEQWTDVCHWKTAQDNGLSQMDITIWHPLHHWILALRVTLVLMIEDSVQGKRMESFCEELGKYVEVFATTSEKEWVSQALKGSISDWGGLTSIDDEHFDVTGSHQTSMFVSESLVETLKTAVWRVNQNLEGSEDCFNWLLTTEELFDDPTWLECITNTATKFAGKDQLVMIVDIVCVRRQMMESMPGCSSDKVFEDIKEVLLRVFKELSSLDQEDILKYTFSMSVVSGLDIEEDSVLFHPINCGENKQALQEQLQVVFNKLVDSSISTAFTRALSDIKQMALMCPYLVLNKALHEAVKFRNSNTVIYKILQEVPGLCAMSTSDTSPTLLCQILSILLVSVKTKQEEKNLTKLVQLLLQPYKQDSLPGFSDPLLSITELVQSCIIPPLKLSGRENLVPGKLSLKLLQASLSVLSVKGQTSKTFILKYLIPILLTLLKQLDACKVSWEGMSPRLSIYLSLAEVADTRSLLLDTLEVSTSVILKCFQGCVAEIAGPIEWLSRKVNDLDWTTALYIKPLKDMLSSQHHCIIPEGVLAFCDLSKLNWKSCGMPDYDVVHALCECCAVSDSMLSEVVDSLRRGVFQGLTGRVVKNVCQVMTYFTSAEMSRVMLFCKELNKTCALEFKQATDSPLPLRPSTHDIPSLSTAIVVSSVLHQVFQLVSQPCCSSWATPVILGNIIKQYVNAMKGLCQELLIDDKDLVEDVIANVFSDICHVICLVPDDVTDPLFILALDVASMVGQRHAIVLRDCVAMVPTSVYTESLLQKLGK